MPRPIFQYVVNLILVIFVIDTGPQVHATTYYVSPTGSDSNLGTIELPWQTFNYAQSMLSAGDTLYLRAGGLLKK